MIERTCQNCGTYVNFSKEPEPRCPHCQEFYSESLQAASEPTQVIKGVHEAYLEEEKEKAGAKIPPEVSLGTSSDGIEVPSLEDFVSAQNSPTVPPPSPPPERTSEQETLIAPPDHQLFKEKTVAAQENNSPAQNEQEKNYLGKTLPEGAPVAPPPVLDSDSLTVISSQESLISQTNANLEPLSSGAVFQLQSGMLLGKYRILEKIAQGGMGAVFKAHHTVLQQNFALKTLLAGQGITEDQLTRFHLEAKSCSKMRHKHIVSVHDIGQESGIHYLTMDLIEGQDLASLLREEEELSYRETLILFQKVVDALCYAHKEGILHRDLKPANILVDQDQEPYLTDFGLAKQIESKETLTQDGAILGTPAYMAPEQAMGESKRVGPLSDVYAMGAILYEMLTKFPPFSAGSNLELFHKIIETEPVPPRRLRPSIPKDIETICLKCLEKEPELRYESAQDLLEDVSRYLEGRTILARPASSLERFWKMVKRQKVLSTTIFVSFILLLGVLVWGIQKSTSKANFDQVDRLLGQIASIPEQKKAEKKFQEALALAPSYGRTYAEWGKYLLKKGLVAEALPQLEKALSLNATQYSLHLALAENYQRIGKKEEAAKHLKLFREQQAQQKGTPAYFFAQGMQAEQKEGNQKALEFYNQALEKEPSYLEPRFARASIFFAMGNLDESLTDLDYILKREPTLFQARLLRTKVFLQQKKFQEAKNEIFYLTEKLKMNHLPEIWVSLCQVYLAQNETQKAEECLQQGETFCPNHPKILEQKGILVYEKGNRDESLKILQKIPYQEGNYWKTALYLSKIYESKEQWDLSFELIKKALQQNPKEKKLLLQYHKYYFFSDQKKSYPTLKGFFPSQTFEPKLEYRLMQYALKIPSESEFFDRFIDERFIQVSDFHFQAHILIGLKYLYQGNPAKMKEHWEFAREGQPGLEEWLWYIETLEQEGLGAGAFREIRMLFEQSQDLEALWWIAFFAYQNQLWAEAEKLVAQILEENPQDQKSLALKGLVLCAQGNEDGLDLLQQVSEQVGRHYLVWLAEGFLLLGKREKALSLLTEQSFKEEPFSFALKWVSLLTKLEKFEEAEKVLFDLEESSTFPFRVQLAFVELYLQQKSKEKAKKSFDKATSLLPGHPLLNEFAVYFK